MPASEQSNQRDPNENTESMQQDTHPQHKQHTYNTPTTHPQHKRHNTHKQHTNNMGAPTCEMRLGMRREDGAQRSRWSLLRQPRRGAFLTTSHQVAPTQQHTTTAQQQTTGGACPLCLWSLPLLAPTTKKILAANELPLHSTI